MSTLLSRPGSHTTRRSTSSRSVSKIVGLFGLFLVIVGGGVGLYLIQQEQDVRQQAATGDTCSAVGPSSAISPTINSVIASSENSVQLQWAPVTGATGYTVFLNPCIDCLQGGSLITVPATQTTLTYNLMSSEDQNASRYKDAQGRMYFSWGVSALNSCDTSGTNNMQNAYFWRAAGGSTTTTNPASTCTPQCTIACGQADGCGGVCGSSNANTPNLANFSPPSGSTYASNSNSDPTVIRLAWPGVSGASIQGWNLRVRFNGATNCTDPGNICTFVAAPTGNYNQVAYNYKYPTTAKTGDTVAYSVQTVTASCQSGGTPSEFNSFTFQKSCTPSCANACGQADGCGGVCGSADKSTKPTITAPTPAQQIELSAGNKVTLKWNAATKVDQYTLQVYYITQGSTVVTTCNMPGSVCTTLPGTATSYEYTLPSFVKAGDAVSWKLITSTTKCSVTGIDDRAESSFQFVQTYNIADINKDGKVDLLDYAIMSGEFFQTRTTYQADLNKDGRVDLLDYSILSREFGKGL